MPTQGRQDQGGRGGDTGPRPATTAPSPAAKRKIAGLLGKKGTRQTSKKQLSQKWHIAKLRTPSPKPEVEKKRDITITDKSSKRNRNYKRGIRSEVAINKRKTKHLTKQSEERREHRKLKSETSRGDWQSLAAKARQLAKQPPNTAFKDEVYNERRNSPENKVHTKSQNNQTHEQHTAY